MAGIVDESALYNDVVDVISKEYDDVADRNRPDKHYRYRLELYVNDTPYEAIKVVAVDIQRDFQGEFSQSMIVEAVYGAGTYAHAIYPNKQGLTAKLYRQLVLTSANGKLVTDVGEETWEYQCIVVGDQSPSVVASTEATADQETGDRSDVINVELQLIEQIVDEFRVVEIGGIFKNCTVKQVMELFFANVQKSDTPPSRLTVTQDDYQEWRLKNLVSGADIVEPDNTRVYDHILIPQGTRLVDLPNYLQKTYGVYKTGIGYFFQKTIWFIFPAYHTKRYDTIEQTLTIANIPANRMPGIERTFKVNDPVRHYGKVYMLATGDVVQKDHSERRQMNDGNAYYHVNADRVIDVFSTSTGNVTTVVDEDHEVQAAVESRIHTNFLKLSKESITHNAFVENSRLARQVGSHVQLRWENADIDQVYPGMPVLLLYLLDDNIAKLYGTLQRIDQDSSAIEPGPSEHRHVRNATITIWVERDKTD